MRRVIIFFLLFFLFSCEKKSGKHSYTFYYWKTTLRLDDVEQEALRKATSDKLFIRYFDVDKKAGKFQPIAAARKEKSFSTSKEIVPVVFIMNRTFLHIKKSEISFLAEQIFKMVKEKHEDFGFGNFFELQIDCDWTKGTRQDYFAFLQELQRISQKDISVTLRLHQVKFKQQAGIPPVKKVYLMCYSTSSPLENTTINSILDTSILKNYLAQIGHYPIKNIVVALPIYSWGIVENHLGKHRLINGLSSGDLENPRFERIAENKVRVLKDGFYFGYFMNKDFTIKVEEISATKIDETIRFLNSKITEYDIVYYQLSRKFVQNRNLTR